MDILKVMYLPKMSQPNLQPLGIDYSCQDCENNRTK